MTKEEIIKKGNEKYPQDIIEIINDDGSITREDVNFKVRKAYIPGLIDNNVNLPSGLDEAAVLSANGSVISRQSSIDGRVVYNLNEKCFNHEDLVKQFKKGAEWHARQGQTFESVVWKDSDDGLYVEAFVDENKFKMADNVVIQVIKKD